MFWRPPGPKQIKYRCWATWTPAAWPGDLWRIQASSSCWTRRSRWIETPKRCHDVYVSRMVVKWFCELYMVVIFNMVFPIFSWFSPRFSRLFPTFWHRKQDFFSFKKTADDLPGEANRFERRPVRVTSASGHRDQLLGSMVEPIEMWIIHDLGMT